MLASEKSKHRNGVSLVALFTALTDIHLSDIIHGQDHHALRSHTSLHQPPSPHFLAPSVDAVTCCQLPTLDVSLGPDPGNGEHVWLECGWQEHRLVAVFATETSCWLCEHTAASVTSLEGQSLYAPFTLQFA